MSLAALQCALAELFVDPNARERYASDPAGFAEAHGLTQSECEQLAALSAASVAGYAATLLRKRRAEAARLLPRTRAALGDAFDAAFSSWASRTVLREGTSRYALDALAFCRSLLADRSLRPETRVAIRRDRAGVRASVQSIAALLRKASSLARQALLWQAEPG